MFENRRIFTKWWNLEAPISLFISSSKKRIRKKRRFPKAKEHLVSVLYGKRSGSNKCIKYGFSIYSHITRGTNDKVKAIAKLMYEESIVELKPSFSDLGYNLMEPEEFCETEEEMNIYQNYKIEYNAAKKMASKAYLMNTKNGFWAVAEGYRPVPLGGMTGAGYMKESVKNKPYHYM